MHFLAAALFIQSLYARLQPDWRLLTKPAIQREIHLSASQISHVKRIEAEAAADVAAYKRKLRKEHIRYRTEILYFEGPALQRLGENLTPAQQKRLTEITLRAYGAYVYDAPGVEAELGLTENDRMRIAQALGNISIACDDAVRQYAKEHHVRDRIVGGDIVLPEETPEIHKMHLDRDAKLLEALHQSLSKDQLQRLTNLLGKPFSG